MRQSTCFKIIFYAQGTCMSCREWSARMKRNGRSARCGQWHRNCWKCPVATIEPTQKTIVQVTDLTILNEALEHDSSPAQRGRGTPKSGLPDLGSYCCRTRQQPS